MSVFCLECFMLYINAKLTHTLINGHLINIVLSLLTVLRHGLHQASECVLWNRDMSSTTPVTSAWPSFFHMFDRGIWRTGLSSHSASWSIGVSGYVMHTHIPIFLLPLHQLWGQNIVPGLIGVIQSQWCEWMTHILCLSVNKCHGLYNIYAV